MRLPALALSALALLLSQAGPAKTDEIFLCGNTLLYVDDSNRDCLRDHPCVRAWFEKEAEQRTAASSCSDDGASSIRQPEASAGPGSGVPISCPLGSARDLNFQTTKSGGIEITLPVDGSLTDATSEATAGGQQSSVGCAPAIGTARGAGGPRAVYVHEYYRKDGTRVRAHFRSAPGSGRSRR